MPIPQYATSLVERLTAMIDAVPDAVEVVQLDQPDVGTVQRRLAALTDAVSELSGLDGERPKVETRSARTVMQVPGRLRATGFHASGAMSVALALAPFEDLFPEDPGDDELTALSLRAAERLGLEKLVPDDGSLAFERLWRIKAAGGDQAGTVTDPVLCRAVGAFRHHVKGLPVYGRASATVEVAAEGRLASASVSLRRFAGDEGGRTVAKAAVRSPKASAEDVAARVVRAFGELEELGSTRLVPEWYRFGYLSLSRRQAQGVLAPFYIASIAVEHEHERSAHVIAVPGSEEQFVRLPAGRRSAAPRRQALVPSGAMIAS
jgi:hypothetical protein